jgi:ABC-2 type transport system ATP-binding protein
MEIIRSLHGLVTVFFSTHILSDVESVCDYGLILEKGKVLADDSIENIKKKHASNTAVIRLCSFADGSRFHSLAKDRTDMSIEEKSPVEFILRGKNMQALGKCVPSILSEANIALESYKAYVPSLEDIFLEVTANA